MANLSCDWNHESRRHSWRRNQQAPAGRLDQSLPMLMRWWSVEFRCVHSCICRQCKPVLDLDSKLNFGQFGYLFDWCCVVFGCNRVCMCTSNKCDCVGVCVLRIRCRVESPVCGIARFAARGRSLFVLKIKWIWLDNNHWNLPWIPR